MKYFWEKVKLGNISSMQYGFTASSEEKMVGPKFLRITDIAKNNITWSTVPYCRISNVDYQKYKLEDGDVVIARTGATAGYAKLIKNPPSAVFASYLIRVKFNQKCLPEFGGRVIESNIFKNFVRKNISGSAQPHANAPILKKYELYLPPLKVQKKIASILSAYDELIENNNRRIEILENMAVTIYKEWFVHFRFPGHEKVKMIDSELGKIPEGWETKRLSKIVDTQYGYTESASEEIIGPKFLRGKDINKNSYIIWDDVPYCKIESYAYEKYKLNREDIVIIRMADPGKAGIIEKDIDAVFASYLIRLKIKNGIEPYYLFYFLLSNRYQSYISGASTGTTRRSASAGAITDVDILLPDKNVLDQFRDVVNLLRQLLNTLLEKNGNLRKFHNLLIPKLISGKIDVSDLDIKIEDIK